MDTTDHIDLRRQMNIHGYAIIRKFLPERLLNSLRAAKMLGSRSSERPHFGTVTGIEQSEDFASIILFDQQYKLLEEMGFSNSRFFTGYLISKSPGAPRLHWHQDWWGWSNPISYNRSAPAVYLMYYLTDTDQSNGCLRVLPGSHARRNELHALLGDRPTHPAEPLTESDVSLSTRPDEVEISVSAGDLIVRDGRLLHASHANLSAQDRDLLVLSFVPAWPNLPEELKCAFERKRQKIERFWSPSQAAPVLERATVYHGSASPIQLRRTPDFTR
jgi:Phytanoyl-CoA dioxygenase (PhyH)